MDATAVLSPAAVLPLDQLLAHELPPHRQPPDPPPKSPPSVRDDSAMAPSRQPVDPALHHHTTGDADWGALPRTPPPPHASLAASLSTSSSIAAPGSTASSTASFEGRERFRSDSSLTGGDARLSICSTSGTVYESVVVVGHIYGSDNVVYYLLEVKSWEMPLEGYVIRRRYNDFKQLHRELALCMPTTGAVRRGSAPSSTSTSTSATTASVNNKPSHKRSGSGFGLTTSSLLCTSLSNARPETSPLWSPPRAHGTHHRRNSITGMRLHGVEETGEALADDAEAASLDRRFSAPQVVMALPSAGGARPPWSNSPGFVDLPFHSVAYNREGRPLLPSLPPGGVSSFFTTREMLIRYRIEKFNRILAAVLSDTSTRVAQLLMNFIQDKPSAPQTYVSLNQYAPVEIPWSVERHARSRRGNSVAAKRDKPLSHALASAG